MGPNRRHRPCRRRGLSRTACGDCYVGCIGLASNSYTSGPCSTDLSEALANIRMTTSAMPMTRSLSDLAIQDLPPESQDVQATLETVHWEIRTCRLCVDAGFIPASLPIF